MSQLGKAYIEVKADLRRFPAELKAGLKKALADALNGVDFGGLATAAEEGGEQAADSAADGFNTRARDRFQDSGRRAGRSMLQGLRDIFRRDSADSNGFLASLTGLLQGVGGAVTGALGNLSLGGGEGGGLAALLARLTPGGGGGGGGGDDGRGLVAAMVDGFGQIAQTLEDLFASGTDFLALLQSGFSSIFAGRGEQISEFLSGQYERIKELWGRLRERGTEVFNNLFNEQTREHFRNLIQRGRDWFTDMGRRGRTFFDGLRTRFGPFFRDGLIHGRRFFEDLYARHGRGFFGRLNTASRGFFSRIGTQFGSFATRMGTQISEAFSRAFAAAGPAISDAFSKISSALGSLGGPIGAVLPLAGMAAIIPTLVLIAGAATQAAAALLALPAALGVVGAAIAPVMIALSGFTDAVGAGLSGDTEKFNEALKGLAPNARIVARELVALGPQFKSIKNNVQNAFFKPLISEFKEIGQRLLPIVNKGLTQTASSMGWLVRELISLLTEGENLKTFQALFESANRVIMTMEPAVAHLAQALLNLIRPALPFIERGATAFRDFAASVEGFTRRISGDGTLTGWFEKAGHIIKTGLGIAKEFGAYLIRLLGGKIGDNGSGFLDDILSVLKDINAFMATAEGQEYINNVATGLKAVGKILTWLLSLFPYLVIFINSSIEAIRVLGRVLEAIGRGAVEGVLWLGEFFADLWETISTGAVKAWDATMGFFATIGGAIANFFTKTIPQWFDAFLSFFEELPGKAVDAGGNLASTLKDWAFQGVKGLIDGILFGIGVVIGLILAFPGLVLRALQALPGLLASFWDTITTGAVTAWNWLVDTVVGAVMAIPGLLAEAGRAIWNFFVGLWNSIVELTMSVPGLLADAGRAIGTFFHDLWTGVITDSYNAVVSGVNSVIDWFASIPGRIAALGPKILAAARGIGSSIAKGLSEIGNFATDLGGKVLASLKSGINYVVDGINRGIAAVDDKIPGGLPRLPRLARGAIVDTPTVALFGEAGAEVVIPLTNRARAQELAEQSGLLSMLRGAGGGTNVTVIAYLDPSGVIIPVVRTVVDDTLDSQGNELPYARAA